ncbi:hypothetical protein ACX3O0_07045 [Homoserinimonas sp. A447]
MDDDRLEAFLEDLEIAKLVRERTAAGPATPLEPLMEQFGITLAN